MKQKEEKVNPFDRVKWGVLVSGPCSVLAAHSFEEAVEKANSINSTLVNFKNSDQCNEFSPICFAAVTIWEDSTNSKHEPEKTDWSECF